MHAALKRLILKLSLDFIIGDLCIGLSLANAAYVRSMPTCAACSVNANVRPEIFEIIDYVDGLAVDNKRVDKVEKLAD